MSATQTIAQTSNPEPSIIESEYFTTLALAKELNVSKRTLERWHALRLGPPRTAVFRTILYRREAVRLWLLSREKREVRARA
jgi:hypothetical protein